MPKLKYAPPGFRFSPTDALAIVVTAVGTLMAWRAVGALALLAPITLVHFFLFCNVFRVRRILELCWAATFVVNVAAWAALGEISWTGVLLCQTPVTFTVIILEVRSQSYHGVFWNRRPRKNDE